MGVWSLGIYCVSNRRKARGYLSLRYQRGSVVKVRDESDCASEFASALRKCFNGHVLTASSQTNDTEKDL